MSVPSDTPAPSAPSIFFLIVDDRTIAGFKTLESARARALQYHTRSDGTPRVKKLKVMISQMRSLRGDRNEDLYEEWDHKALEWKPVKK